MIRLLISIFMVLSQSAFAEPSQRCQLVWQLSAARQLIDQHGFGICGPTCAVNLAQIVHQEQVGRPLDHDLKDLLWQTIGQARQKNVHLGDSTFPDQLHLFSTLLFRAIGVDAKIETYASTTKEIKTPLGYRKVKALGINHLNIDSSQGDIAIGLIHIDEHSGHYIVILSMGPVQTVKELGGLVSRWADIEFIDPNVPGLISKAKVRQYSKPGVYFEIDQAADLRLQVDYYDALEQTPMDSITIVRSPKSGEAPK